LDTLRGGESDDLLSKALRNELLASLRIAVWDAALAAPPCNALSRLLFADAFGPRPLRDRFSPWVFGRRNADEGKKLKDANSLLSFSVEALDAGLTVEPKEAWRCCRALVGTSRGSGCSGSRRPCFKLAAGVQDGSGPGCSALLVVRRPTSMCGGAIDGPRQGHSAIAQPSKPGRRRKGPQWAAEAPGRLWA